MKYLLLFLITFTVMATEPTQPELVPFNCWMTASGSMCGEYKDDDPAVLANAECKVGPSIVHPRNHLKLKGDGKVECPIVFDQVRKDASDNAKTTEENRISDLKKSYHDKTDAEIKAMSVPEIQQVVLDHLKLEHGRQ